MSLLFSFAINMTIVIAAASVGSYINTRCEKYKSLFLGLLFGFGTIFIMKQSIPIADGVIVDFRNLSLIFAGFFGGAIPAIIATVISGMYRLTMGSDDVIRMLSIFIFWASLGFYLRRFDVKKWGALKHIQFGSVLATIILILIKIMNPSIWVHINDNFIKIAVALYMILPVGSYLGFKIFFEFEKIATIAQQEHEKLEVLARFEKVFDNSVVIMTIIRLSDWRYIEVNSAWEKILGYSREEIIGRTYTEIGSVNPQILMGITGYRQRLLTEGSIQQEVTLQHKDGSLRTLMSSSSIIKIDNDDHILLISQDISNLRKIENEIRRLGSLNLIGEMAAGIGHEVRNPLTTIRGYLQLFLRKEVFSTYRDQFKTMINELDRANSIITEFLSLAKDKAFNMELGSINGIIHDLTPLIQADAFRLGHDVKFETGNIPDLQIDKSQIRQLILNMTRNGFEAMNDPGVLIIRTYAEGEHIILRVEDTGKGIPSDVLQKIGTPFFTTKENGTGIGLSVCYRIVERHGAKIDIASSEKGTSFIIKFPILCGRSSVVEYRLPKA